MDERKMSGIELIFDYPGVMSIPVIISPTVGQAIIDIFEESAEASGFPAGFHPTISR